MDLTGDGDDVASCGVAGGGEEENLGCMSMMGGV
jgi:hypothetical protein